MRVQKHKEKGFTLIEAAVIILLLSIAIIPVVKLATSKAGDGTTSGVVTGISGGQALAKEQAVANTIMEKALAGDFQSIENPVIASTGSGNPDETAGDVLAFNANGEYCYTDDDGGFLSSYTAPSGVNNSVGGLGVGQHTNERTYVSPKYKYDNQNIYYSWVVEDATFQPIDPTDLSQGYKNFMPKGNGLVKATLKIYSGSGGESSTDASYSVGSYFYKNTDKNLADGDDFDSVIGVVLILDVSLSMRLANFIAGGTGGVGTSYSADTDYLDPFSSSRATPADATTRAAYTTAYVSGAMPYANATAPVNFTSGKQLPMRMSSGLKGYDPAAVASPYLVYRPNKNDLFFGKALDNTLTPYDERYNPCITSTSGGSEDLPDLPGMLYAAAPSTSLAATCSSNSPHAPADPTIHVPIPSLPVASIKASLEANATLMAKPQISGATIDDENEMEAVFGPIDDPTPGTGCIDYGNMGSSPSNCVLYDTSGQPIDLDTGTAGQQNGYMIDSRLQRYLSATLMGHPDHTKTQSVALSRIESARTAMLAFVETIEQNTELSDKFRIGLVPFSTRVVDGSGPSGQNEVITLDNAVGPNFTALKDTLYRVNRACKFTGASYGTNAATMPNCPASTQPLTLVGGTNIAHALYYADNILDDYHNNHEELDTKMIVLLTDGSPNQSATGVGSPTGVHFPESAHIKNIVLNMSDVTIYSIGLLCEHNAGATGVLNEIATVGDNSTVYVSSVADLTPVFESIANQAEMLLLKSLKDRYEWLG